MAESFYVPLGDDRWQATVHTTGPWDPRAQHGGPPSALLCRAMQRVHPRDDMMITRFTCEILRPIPVGELTVSARRARRGMSVELLEASLSSRGHEVARASAWRVQRTEAAPAADSLAGASRLAAPPPLPGKPEFAGPPPGWVDGYMSAIDIRAARGSLNAPGPGAFWGRMLYPLVPGEEPSPVERALVIADSGNGASLEIDIARWFSVNTELTVHLHREPVGEWICLDAQTTLSQGGTGIATSVLSDLDGPIGVGAQALLIAARPARQPQPV
jgi:hypothetical protein